MDHRNGLELGPPSARPLAIMALAGFLALTASASACRSSQRGMRVGASDATLKVTLNGLRAGDTGKKEWIYELSNCVAATSGELGDEGVVTFKAAGLKKDMIDCQLRVKLATEAPTNFDFGPNGDRTVLYWARAVSTYLSPTGVLEANASLEPLYNILPADSRQIFTVTIPVEWPAVESTNKISAQMNCTPHFDSVGFYTASGEKAGTIRFNWSRESKTDYNCTTLVVHASTTYRGELGEQGKFSAGPGDAIELSKVSLTQISGTTTGGSKDISVQIPTTPEMCDDKSVFDINKRTCVPK